MTLSQTSPRLFSGEFCHRIDAKNRISIPASFRQGDADDLFIMPDLKNRFLRIMPPSEHAATLEKIETNPEMNLKERGVFLRYFFSQVRDVQTDKQGRLLIPPDYCTRLNLSGDLMFVGTGKSFELWNRDLWDATKEKEQGEINRLAEIMGFTA